MKKTGIGYLRAIVVLVIVAVIIFFNLYIEQRSEGIFANSVADGYMMITSMSKFIFIVAIPWMIIMLFICSNDMDTNRILRYSSLSKLVSYQAKKLSKIAIIFTLFIIGITGLFGKVIFGSEINWNQKLSRFYCTLKETSNIRLIIVIAATMLIILIRILILSSFTMLIQLATNSLITGILVSFAVMICEMGVKISYYQRLVSESYEDWLAPENILFSIAKGTVLLAVLYLLWHSAKLQRRIV